MEATDVMRLPTVQTLMAHILVNVISVTQEMVTFVVVRSRKCSRSDEGDDNFLPVFPTIPTIRKTFRSLYKWLLMMVTTRCLIIGK